MARNVLLLEVGQVLLDDLLDDGAELVEPAWISRHSLQRAGADPDGIELLNHLEDLLDVLDVAVELGGDLVARSMPLR
jgi:hypothetical protein